MAVLRTLIVDDEPLARQRLMDLLADIPEVEVVAEASDGAEALDAVQEHAPDLMFLDVQMPELTGLEVMAELESDRRPATIFATAYDDYAVSAFDAHAVDYLMKPIAPDRLRVAVDRALERRRSTGDASSEEAALDKLLDEMATRTGHRTRFAVKVQNRFVIVDVAELSHIEAEGNYVRLHTPNDSYLYRTTMTALESSLDPAAFVRIHRSYILRIDKVSYIEGWAPSEYLFRMEGGQEIVSSRGYARRVRDEFGL